MTSRADAGLIVSYPYLWRWQRDDGRDNAEKNRPVCLAIVVRDKKRDLTHLVILAISGTPPAKGRKTLEIPMLEIRRAGLSAYKQAWLTVDEYNYDIVERSFHFDPNQQSRGSFSPSFMERIRQAIRPMLAAASGRIDRTS